MLPKALGAIVMGGRNEIFKKWLLRFLHLARNLKVLVVAVLGGALSEDFQNRAPDLPLGRVHPLVVVRDRLGVQGRDLLSLYKS